RLKFDELHNVVEPALAHHSLESLLICTVSHERDQNPAIRGELAGGLDDRVEPLQEADVTREKDYPSFTPSVLLSDSVSRAGFRLAEEFVVNPVWHHGELLGRNAFRHQVLARARGDYKDVVGLAVHEALESRDQPHQPAFL